MKRIVVATLTALMLTSCSASWSADLTRPQAKAILSKSRPFVLTYNQLTFLDNGFQEFVAEGGPNNPEFSKVFTVASPLTKTITLRTPVGARIDEITGIADAGHGMKEVLLRWSMVNVPDVLKPLVVSGGTGRAIMRLYDDGWRVENGPNLGDDTAPPTLTAAQQRQAEAFKEAERNRLQGLAHEEQLRKEKLEASMKPSKVLYHFQTAPNKQEVGWDTTTGKSITYDVDVTDADLTVTELGHPKPYLSHQTWASVLSIKVEERWGRRTWVGLSSSNNTNYFYLATSEEAQQVCHEMQNAHDAWVATYGSLIRH